MLVSLPTYFVRVHGPLVDKHTCLGSPTLIPLASREPAFAEASSSWAESDQESDW